VTFVQPASSLSQRVPGPKMFVFSVQLVYTNQIQGEQSANIVLRASLQECSVKQYVISVIKASIRNH
jgi:hypothetical protein